MCKRPVCYLSCVLVLAMINVTLGELVGHWTFDDAGGTIADSSGQGNNGTVAAGSPTAIAGVYGRALEFHGLGASGGGGDYIQVPHSASLDIRGPISIALWIKPGADQPETQGTETAPMAKALSTASPSWSYQVRYGWGSTQPYMAFTFNTTPRAWAYVGRNLDRDEWCHIACSHDGTTLKCYLDGVETGSTPMGQITSSPAPVLIGSDGWGCDWIGGIDDVRIYNHALTVEELAEVLAGGGVEMAKDPVPEDGATDVPSDAVLSWTGGAYAVTHDVYLGTNFEDVNNASRANAMGVLAGQGQTAAEFDPDGLLEYGQTYFWRVDEVNGAPDNTIFKGQIWSFTAEPPSYPIESVTATASSFQPNMGPENTVNGSGLDADDRHSTEATQMWMTTGTQPHWIQFEFEQAYKLDKLLVWNSNQMIEGFIGFGARDVTVEYSADGQTWTTLDGVPEFAKAPGSPTYTGDTTVIFGGVLAKFVKLTIDKAWGVAPQTGLAEVRFFSIPLLAREPQPADGATGIGIDTDLNWRPGREAESHQVYLGTDAGAVALAGTVPDHSYTPAALDFGTTYFWKVDEIGGGGPYEGDLWSFTTQEYTAIDDFEGYNDDDNRIYDSWIDGLTTKASGSQVGYDVSPFAETTVIYGGRQSMPLLYDNSASPFVSEAERTFDSPQNWTLGGADTLSLYVQGSMPAFAETGAGGVLMNAIGADIWANADEFRYAYKTLNGNGVMVARVESIANSNAWAKGGVMIRQSTEPGSVHAFMALTPGGSSGGNGASFQHRLTAAGVSTNNDSTTVVAAPYWVKIERSGNNFTGSISPDGKTWTQLGTAQTITMNGPVLIGLALCSHSPTASTGAEFSNVSFTGNVTGNWQVAEIGIAQPAGNSVEPLYVTLQDSSGKSKTVVNPDAAAAARPNWVQWKIPLSEFASAGVKMNAVKSMTIGVGNKTAPQAGGTGTLFVDDIGVGKPAQ